MICFQSAIQFFLQFFAEWNGLWNGCNAVPDVLDHMNPVAMLNSSMSPAIVLMALSSLL